MTKPEAQLELDLLLNSDGIMDIREASKITGLSIYTIREHLRDAGLNPMGVLTPAAVAFVQKLVEAVKEARVKRSEKIKQMYETMTLEQIGDELGVTRERVRQLLLRVEITGKNSVRRRLSKERAAQRKEKSKQGIQKRKHDRILRKYGCTPEEFQECSNAVVMQYNQLRWYALRMKILWQLTLPQVRELLQGHEGTMRIDGLCLVRKDESLPYAYENMCLMSNAELSRRSITLRFQREKEFRRLYAQGMKLPDIARRLGVSKIRVANYVHRLESVDTP